MLGAGAVGWCWCVPRVQQVNYALFGFLKQKTLQKSPQQFLRANLSRTFHTRPTVTHARERA
jgi:hypothetical protein